MCPVRAKTQADSDWSNHDSDPDATPWLFLVLRRDDLGVPSLRVRLDGVDEVVIGRGDALAVERGEQAGRRRLALRVPDAAISDGEHARLDRGGARFVLRDCGSTNGTLIDGARRDEPVVLGDGQVLELGRSFFLFSQLPSSEAMGDREIGAAPEEVLGLNTIDPVLEEAFLKFRRLARSRVPVEVRGETGTGKELFARAVHTLSGRKGEFVAVNCGELSEQLAADRLFGHVRGAFTGAVGDALGAMRAADGGTLLLDEVGDLPLAVQPQLLRALQENEVTPVGATRPIPVDLRLVSATHVDVPRLVAEGRFRADLRARLRGYTMQLPPLRERRADLGLLLRSIVRRVLPDGHQGVRFSSNAMRALLAHPFPENIRELERIVEAAIALADGDRIQQSHLRQAGLTGLGGPSAAAQRPVEETSSSPALDDDQRRRRDELVELLFAHGGNVEAVARALDKGKFQIYRWIKAWGISLDEIRARSRAPAR